MSHQLRRLTTHEQTRSDHLESSLSSNNSETERSSLVLESLQQTQQVHLKQSSDDHFSTNTINVKEVRGRHSFNTKHPRYSNPFSSFFHSKHDVDFSCLNSLCSRRKRKHHRRSHVDSMSAMATATQMLRVPPENEKKNLGGQQKREELQREVSMLQNMLNHEEKVREILQQAYNRKAGCDFTIPNNIPPKMKELLGELATVEDEIVQLESQIDKLRKDVKSEEEATRELKAKQLNDTSSRNNHLVQGTTNDQRMAYDNKALHFINKAINGGYSLTDFTINEKVDSPVAGNRSPYVQHPKDTFQERVTKRSGMLKPASPLRDFRHPTPYKPKERSSEIRVELPRKSVSGPAQVQDTGTKWQPNKLSENIMKSLILLYVRLIRTSRQMELEKSGPISRSMYSSVSFRTEPGVNLSISFQKESKQQDPYGIFNIEGAIPRDIGPYKNLVVVTSSSLEPKYVSHSSSIPLFQKLRGLFNSLQKVDARSLTNQQKLAFWINIYNACIMNGFLQFGVPSTPEKLLTLLNKATLNVGGKIVNAQAIERCILRKPTSPTTKEAGKDSKEAIIHQLYGLESMNPNTIFALCCGTRSSPAVRIYTAEGVISELERSKLEYLQASISVTSSKRIGLPELLVQNMHDFSANDMDSLMEWVCQQLPTSGSLRKSIMECFRGLNNSGRTLSINLEKMSYDFEFHYLLQV